MGSLKKITLSIEGMSCINCEAKIEKKLVNTKGILNATVSYSRSNAKLCFDPEIIQVDQIIKIVRRLNYTVPTPVKGNKTTTHSKETKKTPTDLKPIGILILLLALYTLLDKLGVLSVFRFFPQIQSGVGYGMLFVIGLLTSLHCIAMCGGINLTQCVPTQNTHKKSFLKPAFQYNLGRIVSYTGIGGVVGRIGEVTTISPSFNGLLELAAGIFMVIMGITMLNLFPSLRKFTPRIPRWISVNLKQKIGNKSPLFVGLLNGLMPCGPLQAMQLYALSTGSLTKGALAMFMFAIGTVPLMFGFGAISTYLSKKFTHNMLKISGALVVFLGVGMLSNGMSLTGIVLPPITTFESQKISIDNQAKINKGIQYVTTSLSSGNYQSIRIQKGVPLQWIIRATARDLNGCNNEIIITAYGIQKKLKVGDNLIEFTPKDRGTIPYSCWMGMIQSTIEIVDGPLKGK